MDSKICKLLTDYMIMYPIKWYTFVNRILCRCTVYKNIMVINKNIIEKNIEVIGDIERILKGQKFIYEANENKDFITWYFYYDKQITILRQWFSILVLRIISDFCIEYNYSSFTNDDFFIQVDNIRIITKCLKVKIKKRSKEKIIVFDYNYYLLKRQLSEILIVFFMLL